MAAEDLHSNIKTETEFNQIGKQILGNKKDIFKKNDMEEIIGFEQALQLTGTGRYCFTILFVSIFTLLAACAEIFSIGIIVTSSQCDLDLDVYKKGLISAVPMLGVIVSAHFWGYLADTKGRKYTLKICVTGTLVTAMISSFANNWIYIVVAKLSSAICASGSNAVIYTLLGESTPQSLRGRALLIAGTGIMFSQGIIVSLAYPTLQLSFCYYIPFLGYHYRPWRLLIQVIGLCSVLNLLLLILYTYESPKFHFAQENHDKGLEILKRIYKINNGSSMQNYPVKRVVLEEDLYTSKNKNIFRSMWDQTVPLLSKKHFKNTLLICYICIVAYCVTPPLSIWLPEIFNSFSKAASSDVTFCQMFQVLPREENVTTEKLICNDEVADFTFVALICFATYLTLSSTIAVTLIKYIGKKWMFIGIHLLCAILAFVVDFVSSTVGIVVLVGVMTNVVCMGVTTAYAVELFPTYLRAMAVCLTMMIGRAISFVFINIIGTQLLTNCNNFLYFLGAFLLSGALVGIFLPGDKKKNCDIENNSTEFNKESHNTQA